MATIELRPLDEGSTRTLVAQLLGLSGDLATRVEHRTAGNPLFAVELVRDWVQRGVLRAGPTGLRLVAGAGVDLPANLASTWRSRIDALLDGLGPDDGIALELAATLGDEVEDGEWDEVCRAAGVAPSTSLIERLARRGLARWGDDDRRWTFAHGLLRESVEKRAREAQRSAEHHSRCADMLAGSVGYSASRRRTSHLRAAGRHAEAIEPLRALLRLTPMVDDARLTSVLLDELGESLDAIDAPQDHPARLAHASHGVLQALVEGDRERAERIATQVERVAAERPGALIRAVALRMRGNVLMRSGALREAASILREAVALPAEEQGVDSVLAGLGALVHCLNRLADHDGVGFAEQRLALTRSLGRPHEVASACGPLVQSLHIAGRYDDARAAADEGLALAESLGLPGIEAYLRTELGEIARAAGDLASAERHYRRSVELMRRQGEQGLIASEWNLGLVGLQNGRFGEARPILTAILARVTRSGARNLEGLASLHLACCAAADGDSDEWDSLWAHGTALLSATGHIDLDLPRMAVIGGDLAASRGWIDRARAAWELAASGYRRLGREEDARAVTRRMERTADVQGATSGE